MKAPVIRLTNRYHATSVNIRPVGGLVSYGVAMRVRRTLCPYRTCVGCYPQGGGRFYLQQNDFDRDRPEDTRYEVLDHWNNDRRIP